MLPSLGQENNTDTHTHLLAYTHANKQPVLLFFFLLFCCPLLASFFFFYFFCTPNTKYNFQYFDLFCNQPLSAFNAHCLLLLSFLYFQKPLQLISASLGAF